MSRSVRQDYDACRTPISLHACIECPTLTPNPKDAHGAYLCDNCKDTE